jgi:hypothetical protein
MRDVPVSDGCHADSDGSDDDMIRDVSSGVSEEGREREK